MNLLIIDTEGTCVDFALRAEDAGHQVKTFLPRDNGTRSKIGDGLIEKVPEWEKWMAWADLILPTNNVLYLDRLEYFRGLRYPIFGPSKQSAELEIQRGYGMEVMKKHGLEVPPYKMFKSLDEAETYCWKSDRRYVFKTLGSEDDKSLTYAAMDSADMINRLRRWKKSGKKLKGACMLQEFIDGIEMGVSAWVGSKGFLAPKSENFEYKKLMSGNYGPVTGEMGTAMIYTQKSSLFSRILAPFEKFLVSVGHRGDVDINCIVDSAGKAWPLEWTCRLGYPASWIMLSQHEGDPVKWMLDALEGRDSLKVSEEPHIGVVIAQPRFPYKGQDKDEVTGVPIRGVTEKNWGEIHLCEAMIGKGVDEVDGSPREKDMLLTTGQYLMTVVGSGSTFRQARSKAYSLADEIHVPGKIVRDDIGQDLKWKLPQLHEHGFALTAEY